MAAAIVVGTVVLAVMMIADSLGVIGKTAFHQSSDLLVHIAGCTGIEGDACFGKGSSRTAADTAADEGIDTEGHKEIGQSAVTAAHGGQNDLGNDGTVLDLIDFKEFGVAEMLEHLALIVSYCHLTQRPDFPETD